MTWVFEKAKERAEEHSIEVTSNPNPNPKSKHPPQ